MMPLLATAGSASGTTVFESLTESLFRIPDVLRSIPDLIREPSANPVQAVLLFGILIVLVLIVVVSALLVVMGRGRPARGAAGASNARGVARKRKAPDAKAQVTLVALVAIACAAVWVVAGVSTSTDMACKSCHTGAPHGSATGDAHAGVGCVACHETGGLIAAATIGPIARYEHFMSGVATGGATSYGKPVASDSCAACHRSQITGVFIDEVLAVRVSHKEPMAAGARCTDCHALDSGKIPAWTTGMTPCLRCHSGTLASASCPTCHAGDPSRAARSTEPTAGGFAKILVSNPQCGSCHTSQAKCDGCHGIRMPHTEKFMRYGHAREGVIDIWDNGGRTCSKCHYEGHRPCTKCHRKFPSHPMDFKKSHQAATWTATCGCHGWNPRVNGGVLFCEICHETKPAGVRSSDASGAAR